MKTKIRFRVNFQPLLIFAVLLVLVFFLSFYSDAFMTKKNWINIINNHMAHQLILAIGLTFVIASSGIDLSVGSILALSGIVLAYALQMGMSIPSAILIALVSATGMGMINGIIITNLKINSLIITLGTASVYRGLAIIVTGGTPIYGMPKEFLQIAKGNGLLPTPVLIAIVTLVIALLVFHFTKWGQYILTMGTNEEALKRQGVSVTRYKVSVYAVSGFLAGLATIIITARLNTAEATAGIGMEMNAIASVIMGGTLLSGGKGTILGTTIACLLLSVIKNGLTMMSIDAQYQEFIIGMLLLAAVIITELRRNQFGSKSNG